MNEEFKKLPLRRGVGIAVLNKDNKIFVAKRIDNPKNFWQMPQGGVNKDENFYTAALRELKEETNISSIKFIKETENKYDLLLSDAFEDYGLPEEFCSISYFESCRNVLSEKGIFMINFWGSDPRTEIYKDRINLVFGKQVLFVEENKNNKFCMAKVLFSCSLLCTVYQI